MSKEVDAQDLGALRAALRQEQRRAEIRLINLEADKLEREARWDEAQPGNNNSFIFMGTVDRRTVLGAMGDLSRWARHAPNEPITVFLNTEGGSVLEGLAFYDFLRSLSEAGHWITTHTLGQASSMGGIILQAGDHRIMGAQSWLLIHEVSSGIIGNVSEMKDQAKFVDRLLEQCLTILAERSALSKTKIKNRMTRTDWWLNAEEALESGFCDEIG